MDTDKVQQRLIKYRYEYNCAVNKAERIHIRKVLNLLEGIINDIHETEEKQSTKLYELGFRRDSSGKWYKPEV